MMKKHASTSRRIAIALALGAASLQVAPGTARADQITLGGIPYPNVKVRGMREGKLLVQMPAGQREIPLNEVEALQIDALPELAKADEALNKKQWAEAADLYIPLLDKVQEDYLKILIGAKLVVSLDRAGRFEEAVRRYAALLKIDHGPLVEAAVPKVIPKTEEERAAMDKIVDTMLKAEGDPLVKKFLEDTKSRLAGDEVAGPEQGTGPAILVGDTEAARDLIQEDLDAGKFQEALARIEPRLNQERQDLSKLLRQQGDALAGLGRQEDAAVAYMRVVVHFRPGTSPNYVPALIGAASSFHAMDQNHHAKALLQEAFRAAAGNEEAIKKITELSKKIG